MKELKFRIWIKDEKRYYDESDEESYMIVPNGNVTYTSEAYEEDGVWFNDTTRATNDVIVEQYTGLKDKNGKEIYEGDVVNIQGIKYYVDFEYGGFWFNNDNRKWKANRPFTHFQEINDTEVIGNIHENADLLEDK